MNHTVVVEYATLALAIARFAYTVVRDARRKEGGKG